VVSNPEFLREGVAVQDFLKPDRVVVGTSSAKAEKVMRKLYEPFVRQGNPIIFMDERSAEMTKYAANSFLATKISFMNEIANLCELTNANVDKVRKGIGTDTRIGKRFLFPGVGYGGSCFPKDVQALHKTSQDHQYDFRILDAVMKVNENQKLIIAKRIISHFDGDLTGKKIALWGLAFKPSTDDIREAPALYTIDLLLKANADISVYDPEEIYGDKLHYAADQYDALKDANALAIMTEWNVFRTPDFQKMKSLMKSPLVYDGRNLFKNDEMDELGSHLSDKFFKEGFDVIGMDNLLTGDMDNISHLMSEKHFSFYHHDVSKFVHVPGELDYILHFASPASPIDYLKMPIQTLKVGSLGTHNLLGLAKAKNACLLIASTSEVYGDPLVHPQTEEYWGNVNPIGPRGVYDEAKRFQEAITMAYHTYHGLDIRIVRIFNTYGPRMRLNDGRALPAFFSQAIRGEDITVFGDGSQTRSFCYVDDLIDGIYKLLHSNYTLPVNIGNPVEISIKQAAEEIVKLTNSSSKITYLDLPKDDPKVRQPDISRAKEILNWEPKVSREEGLKITYEYFAKKIKSLS